MRKENLRCLTVSGLCLALAVVLPLLTGQLRETGKMLCPMHFPVILCGFVCGFPWGAIVGIVAPLFRSLIFGMPSLYPTAIAMSAELFTYGLLTALLSRALPYKTLYIYVTLLVSMIAGRLVSGAVQLTLVGFDVSKYPLATFISAAVTSCVPGIILQIVIIPPLVKLIKPKMRKGL